MSGPTTPALRRASHALAAALLLAVAGGCSTQRVQGPGTMAGMAPMLSVERFLQASNARDYDAMARIFGTREGPVAETGGGGCGGLSKLFGGRCASEEEVERRMAAIAEILRHEDYRIASQRSEPGRTHPAQRIGVDLTVGREVIPDVAFIVVQDEAGGWLVEFVDLEKVAGV